MSISLNGLASNLDTAGMLSKLMEIDKIPYDNLAAKKSNLAAEQNVFRTVNSKISALRTAIADLKFDATFKKMAVKSSDDTVLSVSGSNAAFASSYNIKVEKLATAQTVVFKLPEEGSTSTKLEVTVGDKTKTFETTKTGDDALKDLMKQVNDAKLDVKASVISLNNQNDNRLVLTSSKVGSEHSIQIANTTGIEEDTSLSKAAQDAIVDVNGIKVTRSSNTITDVIEGVTLQLHKAGNASVETTLDTEGVTKQIEGFVKAYNELVDLVNENLKPPVDEKKVNPLQGDSLLKAISSQAYRAITDIVGVTGDPNNSEKVHNMLSQIGLEIDKGATKASEMTSRITFDKTKFKEAFQAKPEEVARLFNQEATEGKSGTGGVVARLDELLRNWNSSATGLIASKVKGYDTEIAFIDERMERMSIQIDMKYERMKKQFTAMEVALTSLQGQQNWMNAQISMLTNLSAQKK